LGEVIDPIRADVVDRVEDSARWLCFDHESIMVFGGTHPMHFGCVTHFRRLPLSRAAAFELMIGVVAADLP
jgi:hypothetical protein